MRQVSRHISIKRVEEQLLEQMEKDLQRKWRTDISGVYKMALKRTHFYEFRSQYEPDYSLFV